MLSARRSSSIAAAALLALAGCAGNSKYFSYRSPFGDFVVEAPQGWKAIVDGGRDHYQITFTGPFEPAFYRGVPAMSVRWYRANRPHRLPDGNYETYASVKDFMVQTLRDVYGPDGYFKAGDDYDQGMQAGRGDDVPDYVGIELAGRPEGIFYVAYHNVTPPPEANLGVVSDDAGHRILRERHGYAILPVRGGFYVLTYPATRNGYARFKPQFLHFIKQFRLLREGPA